MNSNMQTHGRLELTGFQRLGSSTSSNPQFQLSKQQQPVAIPPRHKHVPTCGSQLMDIALPGNQVAALLNSASICFSVAADRLYKRVSHSYQCACHQFFRKESVLERFDAWQFKMTAPVVFLMIKQLLLHRFVETSFSRLLTVAYGHHDRSMPQMRTD